MILIHFFFFEVYKLFYLIYIGRPVIFFRLLYFNNSADLFIHRYKQYYVVECYDVKQLNV